MDGDTPITILVGAIAYQTTLLHLIERRIQTCAMRGPDQPRTNKRFVGPVVMAILAAGLMLLASGCVRTRAVVGNAELDRTALLVKLDVPNIEVTTNGTFKATLTSDARAEVITALLQAIAAALK